MALIAIDPGHGGSAPGACYHDLVEKDLNLQVALETRRCLLMHGHSIGMTREDDVDVGIVERVNKANVALANVFISIHFNAYGNSGVHGYEVCHFPGSSRGLKLADAILAALLTSLPGHSNRGSKPRSNIGVLRLTSMTAVLVECEFISNPKQAAWLKSPDSIPNLASAIARGTNNFLLLDV